MKIRPSSIVHALIGGAVVGAVVFAGQPADKPSHPALPAGMDAQKAKEEYMKLMAPGKRTRA